MRTRLYTSHSSPLPQTPGATRRCWPRCGRFSRRKSPTRQVIPEWLHFTLSDLEASEEAKPNEHQAMLIIADWPAERGLDLCLRFPAVEDARNQLPLSGCAERKHTFTQSILRRSVGNDSVIGRWEPGCLLRRRDASSIENHHRREHRDFSALLANGVP